MEDQKVKNMAVLLRNGATMLDKYCPNCQGILFRLKNNQIFCPSCQQEIKIISNNEQSINKVSDNDKTFFSLNNIFSSKLAILAKRLEKTDDLFLEEKILENCKLCLENIQILRDLGNV